MTPEESRAAFEKWYFEAHGWELRVYTGDHPFAGQYTRPEARMAWAAWQAAIKWKAGEE